MMKFCNKKDALVDLLKDYGYYPVALPREGIRPLQIIERIKTGYQITSKLEEIFIAVKDENGVDKVKLPSLPKLRPSLNVIKGKQSSRTNTKTGIQLLENWLHAIGGSALGLKSAFANVDKFVFQFKNAKVRELDHGKLDKYLNNSKLDFGAKSYIEKLKTRKLFVITSVLLSNSFLVHAIDKDGQDVDVKIAQDQLGSIKLNSNRDYDNNLKMEFKGKNDIVFGIKAVQIRYEEGEKDDYFFNIVDAKRGVLRSDEQLPVELLVGESNFLNI